MAWRNLIHAKSRTLVATAGVGFALTLVFMQHGFLGSVYNTATRIPDHLDFDVAIVSPRYHHITEAGTFPEQRLYEARSVPGVVRASPLYLGFQQWYIRDTGKRRSILVIGVPPDDRTLNFPGARKNWAALEEADSLLIDSRSNRAFEPRQANAIAVIGGNEVRVAGQFTLGTGFAADGLILVNDLTFRRLFAGYYPPGRASLGLLKVAPGRAEDVAHRLRQTLGREDIQALTRDELKREKDTRFWVTEKSIGVIFWFGVLVASVVGLVVVYQVLSSDIIDHFREYATLKAIGYTNRDLASVVLQQALILSVAGYIPAFFVSLGLYWLTRRMVDLPIEMTWSLGVGVLVLSAAMCVAAAMLSVRKVASADPADLF